MGETLPFLLRNTIPIHVYNGRQIALPIHKRAPDLLQQVLLCTLLPALCFLRSCCTCRASWHPAAKPTVQLRQLEAAQGRPLGHAAATDALEVQQCHDPWHACLQRLQTGKAM